MNMCRQTSMHSLKPFLTYKCRSPNDLETDGVEIILGNLEEEVSRWAMIWEGEESS